MEMQYPDGHVALFDGQPRASGIVSYSLDEMIRRNRLHASTVFSPLVHERLGGFRDMYCEDYDFWLRALASGATHLHDPEVLAFYVVTARGKNADLCRTSSSIATTMADLAETAGIPPSTVRLARRMEAYYRASCDRAALETRLRDGEYEGARGAYRACRPAYLSGPKYAVGLVAMTVSPKLYARILLDRRETRV
jgi:hypothetical protein